MGARFLSRRQLGPCGAVPRVPGSPGWFPLGRVAAAIVLLGALFLPAAPARAQATAIYTHPVFTGAGQTTVTLNNFFVQSGSGGDRWLIVGVTSHSSQDNTSDRGATSATWSLGGGQALTFQVAAPADAQPHRTRSEIWALKNPQPGVGSITINLLHASDVVIGAVHVINVVPNSVPVVGANDPEAPSTSVTLSSASFDDKSLVFDNLAIHPVGGAGDNRTLIPGSGQTQQWNAFQSPHLYGASSTKPGSLPTGTSITTTWSGSETEPIKNGDKGGLVAIGFTGVLGPTAVRMDRVSAARTPDGTALRWRTGMEVNNLGFNVYRQEGTERVRLNEHLIAGSAFFAGGTTVSAGHEYAWTDPGSRAQAYWLEDVDLNGRCSWHGPIRPGAAPVGLLPRRSPTLGEPARIAEAASTRQARVSRAPRRGDPAASRVQAQLAQLPAVKIGVREDGWFRVTREQLAAAGLARVPTARLQMFVEGREVPILVQDGGDGRLDPGDALFFYGTGLDTPYTDERVYWLVAGRPFGLRIPTVGGSEPCHAAHSFPYTAERRDRTVYFPSLVNGEADNYFGAPVYGAGVDQALTVEHLAPSQAGPLTLRVTLQGLTSLDEVAPDHRVLVRLNGSPVGTVVFDGTGAGTLTASVDPALVHEGLNTVTLVPLGGPMDVTLVESIRLTYARTFAADPDGFRFTAGAGQKLSVHGFAAPGALFLDITDPDLPRLLATTGTSVPGGFAIHATVPMGSPLEIAALPGARSPASVQANVPSRLRHAVRGAELLIIAPRSFHPGLQPLRQLRQRQGLRAVLIDVQDIYDEFSFGEKTPFAIRNFLDQSRRGLPHGSGPAFVLLAGAASADPRNFTGSADLDLVPTRIIGTRLLETASDDWFVDFNEDGLPEMAVGRLPAQNLAQLELLVGKILAYESQPAARGTLLVADHDSRTGFEATSEELAALSRVGGPVSRVYRAGGGDGAAVLSALNQGHSLVNYLGHGSTVIWRGLLDAEGAAGLGNAPGLSFVVAMTCMNGQFQNSQLVSLAEAFLDAPNGGAVAVWASSAMCEPGAQATLNRSLYTLLFSSAPRLSRAMTLGEAAARAKSSVTDPDVRRSWVFFGDPTTRLR